MPEILEQTINWEGVWVRVTKDKVYLKAIGTTPHNSTPQWRWMEVPLDHLKPELQNYITRLRNAQ